jgi:hypothetical protein
MCIVGDGNINNSSLYFWLHGVFEELSGDSLMRHYHMEWSEV